VEMLPRDVQARNVGESHSTSSASVFEHERLETVAMFLAQVAMQTSCVVSLSRYHSVTD
jgi:hypothetical protein